MSNPTEEYYVIRHENGEYLEILTLVPKLSQARAFYNKDAALGYLRLQGFKGEVLKVWSEAESVDDS